MSLGLGAAWGCTSLATSSSVDDHRCATSVVRENHHHHHPPSYIPTVGGSYIAAAGLSCVPCSVDGCVGLDAGCARLVCSLFLLLDYCTCMQIALRCIIDVQENFIHQAGCDHTHTSVMVRVLHVPLDLLCGSRWQKKHNITSIQNGTSMFPHLPAHRLASVEAAAVVSTRHTTQQQAPPAPPYPA